MIFDGKKSVVWINQNQTEITLIDCQHREKNLDLLLHSRHLLTHHSSIHAVVLSLRTQWLILHVGKQNSSGSEQQNAHLQKVKEIRLFFPVAVCACLLAKYHMAEKVINGSTSKMN